MDRRRINLLNLTGDRLVSGASLRDQCYRHRLYGPDDEIERALSKIEDLTSPILRAARHNLHVPGGGTPERFVLLAFLGLQIARTTGAQTHALQMSKLLTNVAFDGAAPDNYVLTPSEAMRAMLHAAPKVATTLRDLSMTLVVAPPGDQYATSDDPVLRYNTYCEGITDFGVTGSVARGLQIFLPLSPRVLLYLFDAEIYKLRRKSERLAEAAGADVDQLNRLQLVNAVENVYFEDEGVAFGLRNALGDARVIRESNNPKVVRAVEDGNESSQLLHQFWPMPQMALELSFSSVRPKARATDLFDRVGGVRTAHKTSDKPSASTSSRRFAVRSRHELPD
jgi:hypothetical protein